MTLSKPYSWNGQESVSSVHVSLTHSGWDKMDAFFQTTFWNVLCLMWNCMNFDWNFTEVCSQESNLQYSSISSDNGLMPNRQQAIIWTNEGSGLWCIYTSLGLNELKFHSLPRYEIVTYASTSLYIHFIDSLLPSDAICKDKSGSALGQVMACCLAAPSHHMIQHGLFTNRLCGIHSNLLLNTHDINLYDEFENYIFKIIATSSRGQWVKAYDITIPIK